MMNLVAINHVLPISSPMDQGIERHVNDGGIYIRGVPTQISSVIVIKLSSTQYKVQRAA